MKWSILPVLVFVAVAVNCGNGGNSTPPQAASTPPPGPTYAPEPQRTILPPVSVTMDQAYAWWDDREDRTLEQRRQLDISKDYEAAQAHWDEFAEAYAKWLSDPHGVRIEYVRLAMQEERDAEQRAIDLVYETEYAQWQVDVAAAKEQHAEDEAARVAKESEPSRREAVYYAIALVRKVLKAPDSAEFPVVEGEGEDAYSAGHLGDGRYQVSGVVTAQNAFGAMLRQPFDVQYMIRDDDLMPEYIALDGSIILDIRGDS